MEIYIHIPFCAKKCAYCDFFSGAFSATEQEQYFQDLIAEIRECKENKEGVSGIYIGGGTPSFVRSVYIGKVMDALREQFKINQDAEISMEANPGTLSREKIYMYKHVGINRISLGLQSASNSELERFGRIHDFEKFKESYEMLRQAGFQNINVDLISGLPGQKVKDFERTLKKVIPLNPEHISVYSLIIEENTPFYELYGPEKPLCEELPEEETEREIVVRTEELLGKAGYVHYEISNYAKPGYECKHNIGYWTGVPYIGFGAAAASYMGNKRYKNALSLNYRSLPLVEEEVLEKEDQMSEFMILGLRMLSGVSDREFQKRFQCSFFEVFSETIQKHIKLATLRAENDRIFLTQYGLDIANRVMVDFLL